MPRIPDAELTRVKQETDLVALAREAGVDLKRQGKDWVGRCPWHRPDHHASFVVSPDKGLWRCMGPCNVGGSAIDLVMRLEGVGFRGAVQQLRKRLGPRALPRRMPKKVPFRLVPERRELLDRVVTAYQDAYRESPEGPAYAAERGIADPEAEECFRYGLAGRTLARRLDFSGPKGREAREHLKFLGVFKGTGHEHFAGCLVLPVLGAQGEVLGLYGRRIRDAAGAPKHLHLPGPRQGVWNAPGLVGAEEVILCESVIDALSFWCAGFRHVTAAWGVRGFTAEHLEVLQSSGARRVLVAYDADPTADTAAAELAGQLAKEGLEVARVVFPRGMDANEYARQVGPATKSLGLVLAAARPWSPETGEWLSPPSRSPSRSTTPVTSPSSPAPSPETPMPRATEPESPVEPVEPAVEDCTEPATEDSAEVVAEDRPQPAATAAPPPGSPSPALEATTRRLEPAALGEPEEPAASATAEPATPAADEDEPASADSPQDLDRLDRSFGDRQWRLRGLAKNLSHERLRLLVRVARDGDGQSGGHFVDTVDLVVAKQRRVFVQQAAAELEVKESIVKKDLAKLHLELEELQDALIQRELAPEDDGPAPIAPEAQARALALLRREDLLDRILEDFDACGVIGEKANKLLGYVATISRKLERPLAVLLQSSSAAGKSSLMEAILAFVPPEERVSYSAMTGQSLFYMGETDLRHKVLAIVEEEGAERASYALKLLQSEGELTIASTGKDPQSGRLVTQEYHVEGPVMIFLTTTAIEIDEELRNRCLVLSVDESREQTRAIHRQQRELRTLDGLLSRRRREDLLELHRNAQRLLEPLPVVNPYARRLTFLDGQTRTRRDHEKYLTLIEAIALLHQHQRPRRRVEDRGQLVEYLEVTPADLAHANRIAAEVLGRTLDDLPPQTRRFLEGLDRAVTAECERLECDRQDLRFSRRWICETTGWSLSQVRLHLERLVEHEIVLVHRGGRGQSFVYELAWDGEGRDGRPFLVHLIDVGALDDVGAANSDSEDADSGPKVADSEAQVADSERGVADSGAEVADSEGQVADPKRPQNGGVAGGWRTPSKPSRTRRINHLRQAGAAEPEKALLGDQETAATEPNESNEPDEAADVVDEVVEAGTSHDAGDAEPEKG